MEKRKNIESIHCRPCLAKNWCCAVWTRYRPVSRSMRLDSTPRSATRWKPPFAHRTVLVTGPTGSGKTVTLYCLLQQLNREALNLCSVEDPAEIQLTGVNQVSVREKAGLSFATALRAFLRQDPDVIMVGEIRDPETADVAIKAAQTGHLVL